MLGQVLSFQITAFILVLARIGSAVMFLPGFSSQGLPVRVRLVIAGMLSLVLLPVLQDRLPAVGLAPLNLLMVLGGEIIIGSLMGLIGAIVFSSLLTMGIITARSIGLANAMTNDPISQQQGSVISAFLTTTGLALIFATNLHHLMIEAVVKSYTLFDVGALPQGGDAAMMMARFVSESFEMGVQLAAPFLVLNLAFYVGIGVLTRLMPQVPIFFVALPLIVGLGMYMLATVLPSVLRAFLGYFEDSFLRLLGG